MKRIVVLGGGESGTGAAILAKKKKYEVFLSDAGTLKNTYRDVLLHNDIEWEEGKHSEKVILSADEVIKSPGIPDHAEIVVKLRRKGIPVISEIEFASRFTQAKMIGVTGTNGKTTTSSLIYHIFKQAGLQVCLAGNVGKSFAWALSERDYDYFVLELSSFQLDGMFDAHIHSAVLLNITPDHLDRYEYVFENYMRSKFRILQRQKRSDCLIYCNDDEVLNKEIDKRHTAAFTLPYSIKVPLRKGAFLEEDILKINYKNGFSMKIEELALKGKHNIYNSMAAAMMAKRHDIRNERIKESLTNYINVEHRLEFVARIRSVDYLNDSKATNVNATWYALESCTTQVVWIAGGIDKGNDYSKLTALVKEKVKVIICLGTDNQHIIQAFKNDVVKIYETQRMEDAVDLAYKVSQPGETVLLSPACASFDLFANYEDRGNQFKEHVKNL